MLVLGRVRSKRGLNDDAINDLEMMMKPCEVHPEEQDEVSDWPLQLFAQFEDLSAFRNIDIPCAHEAGLHVMQISVMVSVIRCPDACAYPRPSPTPFKYPSDALPVGTKVFLVDSRLEIHRHSR